MNEKILLPRDQEVIAISLAHLDRGQRIIGSQLMEHAGISEKRNLYSDIESLRMKGFPIGGSKRQGDRGYYRAWTMEELKDTTDRMRAEANECIRKADFMEKSFEIQLKSGNHLFDELLKYWRAAG